MSTSREIMPGILMTGDGSVAKADGSAWPARAVDIGNITPDELTSRYEAARTLDDLKALATQLGTTLVILYHQYVRRATRATAIYRLLTPSDVVRSYEQTPEHKRGDLAIAWETLPARLDAHYQLAKQLVASGVEQASDLECGFCHKSLHPAVIELYSGLTETNATMHPGCACDADMES